MIFVSAATKQAATALERFMHGDIAAPRRASDLVHPEIASQFPPKIAT
jgi:hypothetical protein